MSRPHARRRPPAPKTQLGQELVDAIRRFVDCIAFSANECDEAKWCLIRMRDAAYTAVGFLAAGELDRARSTLSTAIQMSETFLGADPHPGAMATNDRAPSREGGPL